MRRLRKGKLSHAQVEAPAMERRSNLRCSRAVQMCNYRTHDPRDAAGEAEQALLGLRIMLNELPPGADVPANRIASLVGIIHDRLGPAVDQLQDYIPRT